MSAIGVAAETAFDTVKTKIGSEILSKFGVGDGAATWGESFAAAGAVNAYESFTGSEMGFMSKMAMTQAISYGMHKFNGPDSEGSNVLSNLGLGGLAAGGMTAGTALFSKMGNEGGSLGGAFDKLFENIEKYADKYLGPNNIVSNTIGELGLGHEKGEKLAFKNEGSMSRMFDGMDSDSLLSQKDNVLDEGSKRRKLMSPEFKLN